MSARFPRWALFVVAALVLFADLATKDWAVQHLANARHPMIVTSTDGATPAAAFALRGIDAETLQKAQAQGDLLALRRVKDLQPERKLEAGEGFELYLSGGTHLAAPRRVRVTPQSAEETLAQAVGREVLVSPEEAAAALRDHAYRPATLASAPERAWSDSGWDAIALTERQIVVIPEFWHFVYAENFGAAWSFLSTAPASVRVTIFVLIATIAVGALSWWLARGHLPSVFTAFSLAGVLGGALGNLIDRLRYGAVIDFVFNFVVIDGDIKGWPVYNVADIGISCGLVALAIEMWRQKPAEAAPIAEAPAASAGSEV